MVEKIILHSLYGNLGTPKTMGLVDRIRKAGSEAEIQSLLSEGKNFINAIPKTVRRWKAVAQRRIEALSKPKEKPAAEKKPEASESKPEKKKPANKTDSGRVVNRHKKYQKT